MKRIQTKTAVAILIAAGSIVPAFGQSRGNGQGRADRGPQQQEQRWQGREQQARSQDSRPQMQPQQARPQQESRGGGAARFQPQRDQTPRGFEQSRGFEERPQSNYRAGNSFQQFGARDRQNDRRSWSDRGGYRGYMIPQSRFYNSFGRQNFFRIGRPVFYNGYPRFSYGGYSFLIVDPLPAYWGPDWYDSDDVYIDYQNDGYYMYNRRYPGAGLALDIEY